MCVYLHLVLDPGSHHVGLVGKLASQMIIRLLAAEFLLQGFITLRNQLLHLHTHSTDVLTRAHTLH